MNIDWFARTSRANFYDNNQADGPGGSNYNENEYWTWVREVVQADSRFQFLEFALKRKEPANDLTKIRVGL